MQNLYVQNFQLVINQRYSQKNFVKGDLWGRAFFCLLISLLLEDRNFKNKYQYFILLKKIEEGGRGFYHSTAIPPKNALGALLHSLFVLPDFHN